MAPVNRSAWRNAFIRDSKNRTTILGGLWAANGITNADLYSMFEIFCSISDTYHLHDDNEQVVARDGQQLQPGNYYVVSNGRFLHCFHHWPLLTCG